MYAVIVTGGKQYRLNEGDSVRVEKLQGSAGDKVVFDKVLMVGDGASSKIGTPVVKKASVEAEIAAQGKARKIIVFKMKHRKQLRRVHGHRQPYTELHITKINA
jgi:large subunit ribosomal protein L21